MKKINKKADYQLSVLWIVLFIGVILFLFSFYIFKIRPNIKKVNTNKDIKFNQEKLTNNITKPDINNNINSVKIEEYYDTIEEDRPLYVKKKILVNKTHFMWYKKGEKFSFKNDLMERLMSEFDTNLIKQKINTNKFYIILYNKTSILINRDINKQPIIIKR